MGSMADAETAAGRFARGWGLHVGEVMQFDNGFYAELLDSTGNGATEVLIDPDTGAVGLEWGPAMMWNTAYGMHPAATPGTCALGPDQAQRFADRWLRDNRSGEHVGEAEAFPGYYTLHTLRGGQVVGMLSVQCATGAVWHHDWHGRLLQMHAPAEISQKNRRTRRQISVSAPPSAASATDAGSGGCAPARTWHRSPGTPRPARPRWHVAARSTRGAGPVRPGDRPDAGAGPSGRDHHTVVLINCQARNMIIDCVVTDFVTEPELHVP